MKKTLLKIATVLLFGFQLSTAMAQAPQKMSYQAVIRNASNTLVTSVPVGMQISILQGSATGTAVYVETQTATTNINGLVTIEIGNGTPVTGTFSSINWSAGPYFIMTETDPTGGTVYSISGTTQLMSVPYALYAETSGSGGAVGATGATGADGINGTNGVDGTNGTNGVDGINGTNGVDGINGTNGVDGINGMNGVDGVAGATGPTGATGVDGINGANGATGATGLAGTDGTNGTNGSTGATGAVGATGLAGTNGTNGTNGSTGATGTIGATGLAGTNGTNGTNGATGTVGATGSTGATGIAGATGSTGATGFLANGTTAGNTTYWNGTAWVTNSSNIFNNGGNIGIGTTTPAYKLDVLSPAVFVANFATSNTGDRTTLVKITNNNVAPAGWLLAVGGTGNGLGLTNGEMYIESYLGAKDFVVRTQASPLTETFRISGSNGAVGIGTATPNAALQFANTLTTRKIVLWEDVNNDHEIYGFGVNTSMLRYQISNTGAVHAFYAGTSATTSTELMRIQGNGNVGIGTAAPGAKLEVAGQVKVTGGAPGVGKVLTSDATGLATWANAAGTLSGTTNYIVKFTGANSGGNSQIQDNGTNVSINAAPSALYRFQSYNMQLTATGDGQSSNYGYRTRDSQNDGTGYGQTVINSASAGYNFWGDLYTFGVAGHSYNDYSRTGGVLGSDVNGAYWSSLGYKSSALVNYAAYGTSTYGTGTGFLPTTEKAGIGAGYLGGLMGGFFKGGVIGQISTGELFAAYNIGDVYTSGKNVELVKSGNEMLPAYAVSSPDITVYKKGKATMNNGSVYIAFDANFAQLLGDVPVVTVSPMGACNGVYIASVDEKGFTIKEQNNGNSNVDIAWIAVGDRMDSKTKEVPSVLKSTSFDANLQNVMYDENNKEGRGLGVWWNGTSLEFGQMPASLNPAPKK